MNRTVVRRFAPIVIVGALPAFLLGLGVVRFMLNHFFVRAPYLLDAGMLSDLSYHDGILLPPAKIACDYVEYYYDVYFSPLTSLFSVISYIVPLARLEWFSAVEGLIYVPIGLATYFVASRLQPETQLRRLPITLLAALAFSFCGIVVSMISFPHFEAAMPGLTCLVLGCVVTGRWRLAWVWLALAASVRQDAGIHIACALAPLWFLRWRGVDMLPTRRKLVVLMCVAVGASVVGMACIKIFFHPFPRLSQAYLGDPLYSHLSFDLIAQRVRRFFVVCPFIYYPFVATCLIALLRRDPRYLLGWASVVPWFLFSFLAVEQVKADFWVYGAGPFLVAMFWVYLYGAHLAPPARRLRAGVLEAAFALVCTASTLGLHRSDPSYQSAIAGDMAFLKPLHRAAVHGLVEAIHEHPATFKRLYVDGAVAALAMEYLDPNGVYHPGLRGIDTVMFHRESPESATLLPDLIANELDSCVVITGTKLVVCTHDPLPPDTFGTVKTQRMPAIFALLEPGPKDRYAIDFSDNGVVFRKPWILNGWFGRLPKGTYQLAIQWIASEPIQLDTSELVRVEIVQGNAIIASATAGRDDRQLEIPIEADGSAVPLAYRIASRNGSPLVITSAKLRGQATAPNP